MDHSENIRTSTSPESISSFEDLVKQVEIAKTTEAFSAELKEWEREMDEEELKFPKGYETPNLA